MKLQGITPYSNSGHIAALIWPGLSGSPSVPVHCERRVNPSAMNKDFNEILILGREYDINSGYHVLAQVYTDKAVRPLDPHNGLGTRIKTLPRQLKEQATDLYVSIDRMHTLTSPVGRKIIEEVCPKQ